MFYLAGLVGRSSGVEGIRILVELRAKSFAGGGDSINGRGLLQSRHMVERYGYVENNHQPAKKNDYCTLFWFPIVYIYALSLFFLNTIDRPRAKRDTNERERTYSTRLLRIEFVVIFTRHSARLVLSFLFLSLSLSLFSLSLSLSQEPIAYIHILFESFHGLASTRELIQKYVSISLDKHT